VIVKHPGCPQWGFGLLVEERDDKRIYDFEDGLSHSIARAFWSKLESVELGGDEMTALEARIKGLKIKPEAPKKQRVRTIAPPSMTFDEQVARFEKLFPGGFTGEVFTNDERGVEAASSADPSSSVGTPHTPGSGETPKAKKAKGGRAQAITAARTLLAKSDLQGLASAGSWADVLARVRQVHQAAGNLLHPLGDLIPFGKLPEDHHAAVAQATVDVLHGDGEYGARFDKYVEVLAQDKLNTWPLATVLSALLSPESHVFVKPSFFEKQAAIVGFDLGYDRLPSATVYERMRALAADVQERLRQKGHAPRDLMDIYAFIWRTTAAPKAPKEKAPPAPKPT